MASAHEGTKELRVLVGILLGIMFAIVLTAFTDAGAQPRTRAVVPSPDPGIMAADLYFDSNSSRLRADAAKILQEKATLMRLESPWFVVLQGYADRFGTPEYNRDLAKRRADNVKRFLMDLGVRETSVMVVVAGQDGAVCDGPTPECQKLNRRVHMEMRKMSEGTASPVTSR